MNKSIIIATLLLSAVQSVAGVGGGGGGVRPGTEVFMANPVIELTGVGVGFRPTNKVIPNPMDASREFVRTIDLGADDLTVLYKPIGQTTEHVVRLPLNDVNPEYSEILLRSWNENSWVELE